MMPAPSPTTMPKPLFLIFTLASAAAALAAPKSKPAAAEENSAAETARLKQMTARFAPTDLTADVTRLSPAERQVLARLIEASKIIDGIFLRQVWSGNLPLLLDLARNQTPEGNARLHYFRINKGPWSRLDDDKPFVQGAQPKPQNGGFYPDDATKEEVEKWVTSLPEDQQAQAKGFFSVIKHEVAGRDFRIVPYNMEYQSELLTAARLLREA